MLRLVFVLAALAQVSACGTKGPLVLPKPAAAAPAAPAASARDGNNSAAEKAQ